MSTTTYPLFHNNDALTFRQQFAISFLATYAAVHFDDRCARGLQESLGRLPVEDADYLARQAWEHWQATNGTRSV